MFDSALPTLQYISSSPRRKSLFDDMLKPASQFRPRSKSTGIVDAPPRAAPIFINSYSTGPRTPCFTYSPFSNGKSFDSPIMVVTSGAPAVFDYGRMVSRFTRNLNNRTSCKTAAIVLLGLSCAFSFGFLFFSNQGSIFNFNGSSRPDVHRNPRHINSDEIKRMKDQTLQEESDNLNSREIHTTIQTPKSALTTEAWGAYVTESTVYSENMDDTERMFSKTIPTVIGTHVYDEIMKEKQTENSETTTRSTERKEPLTEVPTESQQQFMSQENSQPRAAPRVPRTETHQPLHIKERYSPAKISVHSNDHERSHYYEQPLHLLMSGKNEEHARGSPFMFRQNPAYFEGNRQIHREFQQEFRRKSDPVIYPEWYHSQRRTPPGINPRIYERGYEF